MIGKLLVGWLIFVPAGLYYSIKAVYNAMFLLILQTTPTNFDWFGHVLMPITVSFLSFALGWFLLAERRFTKQATTIEYMMKSCMDHQSRTRNLEEGFNSRTPKFTHFEELLTKHREIMDELKSNQMKVIDKLSEQSKLIYGLETIIKEKMKNG